MTLDSFKAFASLVGSDAAVRSQLRAAANADEVVGVAASHGHHFSKTVLLRQHAEALSQAHDHELEGISSWGDALMHCFGVSDRD
jgi:predicted ribosomally synthesized peptide with nif11-like leader